MKVLHLSNSTGGGAGIAAQRLNEALGDHGVDSSLLTLSPSTNQSEFTVNRNLVKTLSGKVNALIAGLLSDKTFFSLLSINVLSEKELRRYLKPEEGILHIHNWFNFLSQSSLMRLANSGYKIVLTLHDERMFTGGCHYALNCRGFETSCVGCPQLSSIFKSLPEKVHHKNVKAIADLKMPLHFISPSKWLAEEALKSSLLQKERIFVIQNSLGRAKNLPTLDERFQNTTTKNPIIRLGVASQNPNSFIKGGDLIKELDESQLFKNHFRFSFMTHFRKDSKYEFWNGIDFLFVPSRIDNSPNVIHEAKFLGIPIIGAKVGGISELMTDTDVMFDILDFNASYLVNLKEKLLSIIENKSALLDSRERFQKWSADSAKKHIEVYKLVLDS